MGEWAIIGLLALVCAWAWTKVWALREQTKAMKAQNDINEAQIEITNNLIAADQSMGRSIEALHKRLNKLERVDEVARLEG